MLQNYKITSAISHIKIYFIYRVVDESALKWYTLCKSHLHLSHFVNLYFRIIIVIVIFKIF